MILRRMKSAWRKKEAGGCPRVSVITVFTSIFWKLVQKTVGLLSDIERKMCSICYAIFAVDEWVLLQRRKESWNSQRWGLHRGEDKNECCVCFPWWARKKMLTAPEETAHNCAAQNWRTCMLILWHSGTHEHGRKDGLKRNYLQQTRTSQSRTVLMLLGSSAQDLVKTA